MASSFGQDLRFIIAHERHGKRRCVGKAHASKFLHTNSESPPPAAPGASPHLGPHKKYRNGFMLPAYLLRPSLPHQIHPASQCSCAIPDYCKWRSKPANRKGLTSIIPFFTNRENNGRLFRHPVSSKAEATRCQCKLLFGSERVLISPPQPRRRKSEINDQRAEAKTPFPDVYAIFKATHDRPIN